MIIYVVEIKIIIPTRSKSGVLSLGLVIISLYFFVFIWDLRSQGREYVPTLLSFMFERRKKKKN